MEINGKLVNGIYIYKDQIKFNTGDLIVFKESLYKVIEDVINVSPDEDFDRRYYKLYFDEPIGTEEDFFSYLKGDTDSSDKLISVSSLNLILNTYFNGFNDKGIIDRVIDKIPEDYTKDYFTDYNFKYKYANPIDSIFVEPNLNNCVFIVKFNVVSDIIGSLEESEDRNVILRQYTYKYNNKYTRIQELFDYEINTTKYRYVESNDDSLNFNITNVNWITYSINSEFIKRVDSIVAKAQEDITDKNNKSITSSVINNENQLNVVSKLSQDINDYQIDLTEETNLITIIYHRVLTNNMNESGNITVDVNRIPTSDSDLTMKYVTFNDSKDYMTLTRADSVVNMSLSSNIIIDKVYGKD